MHNNRELLLHPIGYIETPFEERYESPHQPRGRGSVAEGIITLLPNQNFEQALEDLEGMEKIWLIYWFDRNSAWRPKVLPPRGDRHKRGLFATRAPYRPNPIGLSLVDLVSIEKLRITVRNVDMLSRTPILDIKPYLPYLEAHAEAKAGWIDEAQRMDSEPGFIVELSARAIEQSIFLERHGILLRDHTMSILSRDPFPHSYRRIEQEEEGYVLDYKSWSVHFTLDDHTVRIREICSGYELVELETTNPIRLDRAKVHLDFHALWPSAAPILPRSTP